MRYVVSDDQLRELAFQAGGAATGPLMEDHPDYVFPSERVSENVAAVLAEHKPRFEPEGAPSLSVQEVKTYLDESIRFWRGLRAGTVEPHPPLTADEAKEKAPQYIDALQSVRVSLLGRQLP